MSEDYPERRKTHDDPVDHGPILIKALRDGDIYQARLECQKMMDQLEELNCDLADAEGGEIYWISKSKQLEDEIATLRDLLGPVVAG